MRTRWKKLFIFWKNLQDVESIADFVTLRGQKCCVIQFRPIYICFSTHVCIHQKGRRQFVFCQPKFFLSATCRHLSFERPHHRLLGLCAGPWSLLVATHNYVLLFSHNACTHGKKKNTRKVLSAFGDL